MAEITIFETMLSVFGSVLTIIGIWTVSKNCVKWVIPHLRPFFNYLLIPKITKDKIVLLVRAYKKTWNHKLIYRAKIRDELIEYPFFTKPEWSVIRKNLMDPFVISKTDNSKLPIKRSYILKRWLGTKIWNGELFLFENIKIENENPTITVGIGKYYQYISECKKIEDAAVKIKQNDSLPSIWPPAPNLCDLQAIIPKAGGVGVNAVVLGLKDSNVDNCEIIMQERSKETVGTSGFWAPSPTYAFQPFSQADILSNLSLKNQLFREMAEEFFGVKEAELKGKHSTTSDCKVKKPDHFKFTSEIIKKIDQSIASKTSSLYYLGFGIDGINLEPNICQMLVVRDNDLFGEICALLQVSWESDKLVLKNFSEISLFLANHQLTPGGAYALSQAYDCVRGIIQEEKGQTSN